MQCRVVAHCAGDNAQGEGARDTTRERGGVVLGPSEFEGLLARRARVVCRVGIRGACAADGGRSTSLLWNVDQARWGH